MFRMALQKRDFGKIEQLKRPSRPALTAYFLRSLQDPAPVVSDSETELSIISVAIGRVLRLALPL